MKFCRVLLASIAACVWLTSCGGGGGGGDAQSGSWLTFSPSAVDLTVYQGEPVSFTVKANSSKTIAERIYLGVIDTVGLVTPNVEVVANTKTNYSATFGTNPKLPVGTHNSFLQVRICLDDAFSCKLPYPDSPWQVPIRIKVLPATNLTPLTKLDGERPWGTINGNSSHNAYFSRPVAAENFTRRWVIPNKINDRVSKDYDYSPMNIVGDAIITSDTSFQPLGGFLQSQSEFDGKINWKVDLGENSAQTSSDKYVAVSDGRVAVVVRPYNFTSIASVPGVLRVFSAKTGQLQGNSLAVFGAAPFFAGNDIFLGDGNYNSKEGIYRYDVSSGALVWKTGLAAGFIGFSTPAADSRYVYGFQDARSVAGQLVVIDRATGVAGTNIAVPGTSHSDYYGPLVPVLGNNGMVFVQSSGYPFAASGVNPGYTGHLSLVGFDTVAKSLKWTLRGYYQSNPVDAAGTLYVVNGNILEARKPADGTLLWSWPVPEPYDLRLINIIVVGNLVFLSGRTSTYAIDVTTHQSVWSYPVSGDLAVSDNGVLYIRSNFRGGRGSDIIVAFNLR